jgi:hypothetical protein
MERYGMSKKEVQNMFLDCVVKLGSAEEVYKRIDIDKKRITDIFSKGDGLEELYDKLLVIK